MTDCHVNEATNLVRKTLQMKILIYTKYFLENNNRFHRHNIILIQTFPSYLYVTDGLR